MGVCPANATHGRLPPNAPLGVAAGVTVPAGVDLVEFDALIARLERSALIAWSDRRPTSACDIDTLRQLDGDAALRKLLL